MPLHTSDIKQLLLILFWSLTASPAWFRCPACLFGFGDSCIIYPYTVIFWCYHSGTKIYPYAYSGVYVLTESVGGKLTATIVNLINSSRRELAYGYTCRLTDSPGGEGTIKWCNLLQVDRLGTNTRCWLLPITVSDSGQGYYALPSIFY